MDFSFDDDQQAIAELASQILGDGSTHERLRELERSDGDRFDTALWKQMAEAGLVGVAVPETYGGGGLGFLETALVLEQIGRTAAAIPFYETAVLGAPAVAQFGSEAQKQALLPGVNTAETILTAALHEDGAEPELPATTATPEDGGFRLDGAKVCVPAAQLAARILVPARCSAGVIVFLVDPTAPGVRLDPLDTTTGQPEAHLTLEGLRMGPQDVLGDAQDGSDVVAFLMERGTAGLACIALGVCEEAMRLTAEYTKTRKQFDQPIAMFQAVGHRAADAYIDTEAIRLTAWQAAWRISEGLPAEIETALAKFWAAEGGQRVVHAAQHLHGGVGVDRDYPLHRCFLYAKQLELALGGMSRQLVKIGKILAEQPAA